MTGASAAILQPREKGYETALISLDIIESQK